MWVERFFKKRLQLNWCYITQSSRHQNVGQTAWRSNCAKSMSTWVTQRIWSFDTNQIERVLGTLNCKQRHITMVIIGKVSFQFSRKKTNKLENQIEIRSDATSLTLLQNQPRHQWKIRNFLFFYTNRQTNINVRKRKKGRQIWMLTKFDWIRLTHHCEHITQASRKWFILEWRIGPHDLSEIQRP